MTRVLPLRRLVSAALVVAFGLACGDGGTNPPTPVPTTLTLNKTAVPLDAIGATDQLTPTVRDQNGNTMSGVTPTWTSSNNAVATVSASGSVTAVANGTAMVTATAGSASASATVTVAQVPAQVAKLGGDAQSAQVTSVLTDSLAIAINDRLGVAIGSANVNFSVSTDGGSVSPASATTDASGRVATQWTFGTTSGGHTVTATPASGAGSAQFAGTANPDVADAIASVSGDLQTGLINTALPNPLVVEVSDQYGNGVEAIDVTFSTTDGSVAPTTVATGADGLAQATWTLGPTEGLQTAQASVAGLTGSPVAFTATGSTLSVTAVSPDTLVEGASATITGTGFDPTPANNTVTIDGVAATVTMAVATSLTVTVPAYDCKPTRDADVQVSVGAGSSNVLSHPLRPSAAVTLAVGEMTLVQDPADFCLQFSPSTIGGEEYLVGIGSAAELPTSFLDVTLTAEQGVSPSAPALPAAPAMRRAAQRVQFAVTPELEQRAAHYAAEQKIRQWEREHLDPVKNPSLRVAPARSSAAAMAPPNVGDTLRLHVPDVDGSACDSIGIDVVVKVVGSAGIFVTDLNNPATDSLTDADIQAQSDIFDLNIYDADTTYFGPPSDLDANQRVFVVLTIEVNKFLGGAIAGFVFSGDLFSVLSCASSDQGELFYGHVPDPANVAGTVGRSKTSVLFQMPSLIAHEFAHNIQQSRRIVLAGGSGLASWESEGQATLAEEVVGHDILGNSSGNDYGASTALTGSGSSWYRGPFSSLAKYYGWTGSSGRNANAPEECTLFGSGSINNDPTIPCEPFWFYGASWSFQRYVADRFGQSYPGGETALTRDWIDANPTLNGVANVEALLGVQMDSVFARWAAMHYVDGRVASADTSLLMSSWDIDDVANGLNSSAPLAPTPRAFSGFTATETIRGGSTAYSLLSVGATRPALALRVRDLSDAVLGTAMRPQLWIVRVQ
ncbi:MAG: Ig-like domain-containing protein [Gemmatimonadota bacterium]|nr:Ig-like domain-containing protein [Gemmatimonadota bacterium]